MRWIISISTGGRSETESCSPSTANGEIAPLRRSHSMQVVAARASATIWTRSAPVQKAPGVMINRQASAWRSTTSELTG